jgi:hypothetical protein
VVTEFPRQPPQCACNKIPTFSFAFDDWLPPGPKTSFPVVLRDVVLCDVEAEAVEGCTLLVALACRFAGEEDEPSRSLGAFPSKRLPGPVKGVNFGSSSTAASATGTCRSFITNEWQKKLMHPNLTGTN